MKKKWMAVVLAVLVMMVILVILVVLMFTKHQKKPEGVLDTLESYRGYTRVISQEEYDFYAYFVKRDLPGEVSEEELDKLVKSYAGEVNAAFYLGNQLGFCEAYSFESLKLRMEQENASRQVKIEQGEVVYGLEQFSLQTYFQYTMDNLQVSLMGYLEENADDEILEMAEDYYEENEDSFRYIVEVVYEQTVDGATETLTADADTLAHLGKADAGLADFLVRAEIGDVYEDIQDTQERSVVLKDVVYSEDGYENHAETALYRFVRYELYDQVIAKVAENNPVEFE